MSQKYILNDVRMILLATDAEWARWIDTHDRVVGYNIIHPGDTKISTVFIGIALGTSGFWDRPKLFESLITYPDASDDCVRYCTWEEAQEGHDMLVMGLLKRGIK